jgi:integrase
MSKLSARKVETAKPGKYGDGQGLQLSVSDSGAKKWIFRYSLNGKAHEHGLGSYPLVGLAEARDLAFKARRLARIDGVDPIAFKRAKKVAAAIPTFGKMADEVAAALAPSFRNDKHRHEWARTLAVYAAPLRDLPVDTIDTESVLSILKPLWLTKNETASRLRGRIERVLNAAAARGYRSGQNPAQWSGHLENLLASRGKLARAHHAAMPYTDVLDFASKLRTQTSVSALALEFCILTAARAGEVLGATWSEIDIEARVWTVPAHRMKAGLPHSVPLSDRALEILTEIGEAKISDAVFPGRSAGALNHGALLETLQRSGAADFTVHGFRSAFRDWAGNETHHPREIIEHALAHGEGNATEQAYRRGDALEKRRSLMQAWSDFITAAPLADNVTQLSRRAR